MPKLYTFPTLYDEVMQLSTTKLKQWGYLNEKIMQSTVLTWSSNGQKTGSITILINTIDETPFVELEYKYKNEPRKYKVRLVWMPSNLGKGKIWYFLCPVTKKRCRKLYSIDGYFLHREAFKNCLYESQTRSKSYRKLENTLGAYFKQDEIYEELYSRNFKSTYAGKPTKRFQKLLNKLEQVKAVSASELERLLLFGKL